MSRLVQTRRGVAFHQDLFQVNVAEATADDADLFASMLRAYVARRLNDGMMAADSSAKNVTFDYDDVFVMEFLLGASAACQRASHEATP